MSEAAVNPVQETSQPQAPEAGKTPQPGNGAQVNASTTFNNMSELKDKAPKLYTAMLEGIAMNICGDMKRHCDRLKEIMRDGRRQAEG